VPRNAIRTSSKEIDEREREREVGAVKVVRSGNWSKSATIASDGNESNERTTKGI
jgi:hypothetical protein